ncbi:MAG: hypothetical protein JO307_03495, partial [Bryobacterales bacterium]|nr:hypothetical protein [Bryobacterales bacterium]
HSRSDSEFQDKAAAIRSQVDTRRIYAYNSGRALVIRGTGEQIAQAERLMQQLDATLQAGK